MLGLLIGGAVFVALYVTVCGMLAAGDWWRLQTTYAAASVPVAAATRLVAARVGRTFYQLVRVGADGEALYLSSPPLLLFHGPIRVPWQVITCVSEDIGISGTLVLSVPCKGDDVGIVVYGNGASWLRASVPLPLSRRTPPDTIRSLDK